MGREEFAIFYLLQLIEQQILLIPNFNFPNLRCCKVFFFCVCKELYWHFLMYFGLNLKLLPYSVVSIKRTGSLNYFEVFSPPVLFFHVLKKKFAPPCSFFHVLKKNLLHPVRLLHPVLLIDTTE